MGSSPEQKVKVAGVMRMAGMSDFALGFGVLLFGGPVLGLENPVRAAIAGVCIASGAFLTLFAGKLAGLGDGSQPDTPSEDQPGE